MAPPNQRRAFTICWTNIEWICVQTTQNVVPKTENIIGQLANVSGIVMHFKLIKKRMCHCLCFQFAIRSPANLILECGTNPVPFCDGWQFHFSPHRFCIVVAYEHTKWAACHAIRTSWNMAKWTTIYLYSLNIQHFYWPFAGELQSYQMFTHWNGSLFVKLSRFSFETL